MAPIEAPTNSDQSSHTSAEKSIAAEGLKREILDNAEIITERGNIITKDGVVFSTEDSDSSLSTNIFSDPEIAAHYKAVYENSRYECRHVFDPDLTWTEEEERRLIRKLDWRGMYRTHGRRWRSLR
jgi:hypothetical protein